MNFLKRLFGKKKEIELPEVTFSDEEYEKDYELKSAGLQSVLGKLHDLVGHAIIPFSVGGAVDMYYFPNHIKGTGFATMELIEPDGSGPLPNRLGTYELVAFTKHPYNSSEDPKTSFNLVERNVCGLFTTIGFFSRQAVLHPGETCEVPNGEGEENSYVVFDQYEPEGKSFSIGERNHHLLLCLQVHKSELKFARENGSEALLNLLKREGYYPYCDLDRPAVA